MHYQTHHSILDRLLLSKGVFAFCFIAVFGLSISSPVSSSTPGPFFHFQNLSIEEGLTQSTVYAIMQDKEGFMWFGTRDGLNLYDGIEIRTFRTQPGKPNTLSHPNIRAIAQDHNGIIWLGTDGGGLNRFNTHNETFDNYILPLQDLNSPSSDNETNRSANQIVSLVIDQEGILWVGHRHVGLSRFNPATETFHKIGNGSGHSTQSVPEGTIWALETDTFGRIWVANEQGLWYTKESYNGHFEHLLRDEPVWSLHADAEGALWIGTGSKGLLRLDLQTKEIENSVSTNAMLNGQEARSIVSVSVDKNGLVWIGQSDNGILVWDRQRDNIDHFHATLETDATISDNSIRSIYSDRSGMVWIGTNAAGVYSYSPVRKKFGGFPSTEQQRSVFSNPVTLAFTETNEGRIWIGTERSGVFIFDPERKTFEALPYDPSDPEKLNHQQIITLLTDSEGFIWIGTDGGGLEKWSADGYKVSHYFHDPADHHSLSNDSILFLYEDQQQRLWAGTYRGLNVKNKHGRGFTRYRSSTGNGIAGLSDERILSIHQCRNGILWIGTHGGGLNSLDPKTNIIRSFTPLDEEPTTISSDRVNVITEDESGRLWLGTYHGLNVFNPEDEVFKHYTEADGLKSNIIRGIIQHGDDLWLSTNNGVSRFNISAASIRNFSVSDGLQSNEFKGGAYFKSAAGEIYFGGINGFNVFNPKKLPVNTTIPPVVITSFTVMGEKYEYKDGAVKLNHNENFLTLKFAALDYVSPSDNRYQYMMYGLDADWVDAGNQHEIRYTHIPPGRYTFRIRASNNDGLWNDEGVSLAIRVMPPFWATWWFISLSVMGIFLLGIASVQIRRSLQKREAVLRQRIARNLHDDVSGSLSSIDLFATAIKRDNFNELTSGRYLKLITESARDAKGKISDIIWYVDPRFDDWHSFTGHLHQYAEDLFGAASIDCKVRIHDLPEKTMSLELRQNVWLIMKELLTNIVRHSNATSVSLRIAGGFETVKIIIKDNGIGFNKQTIETGNGIRNVKQRCATIGGSAKLHSEPGNGAKWEIEISV